jgi:preprotein translocase subunit SecB
MQAEVDVNVTAQSAGTYEVALNVAIDAKSEVGIIYRVELVYAGLFRLSNVPQDLLHPVLLANGPKMLFPTLRRVLSDITRDGGFPPLMLDFGTLPDFSQGNFMPRSLA